MSKFKTKKSLGQNFLQNNAIIEKIVETADLDKNTDVIEIGVGSANLTVELAEKVGRVLGFEIDNSLIPILTRKLNDYPNVYITFGDILKFDLKKEIEQQLKSTSNLTIVANIPYYITAPIIHKILESGIKFKNIILMVQKEVAQRIVAKPNTSEYSVLSLYVQQFCSASIEFEVGKNNFMPIPKVDSAVINLKQFEQSESKSQIEKEMNLIKVAFSNRRKQLKNNLNSLTKDPVKQEKISEILFNLLNNSKIRAQELSLDQYKILYKALKDAEIL